MLHGVVLIQHGRYGYWDLGMLVKVLSTSPDVYLLSHHSWQPDAA